MQSLSYPDQTVQRMASDNVQTHAWQAPASPTCWSVSQATPNLIYNFSSLTAHIFILTTLNDQVYA